MTASETAAMLTAQLRQAVLTGSPEGYAGTNAAKPHNVRHTLFRLGIWTEAGAETAFGAQVRAAL